MRFPPTVRPCAALVALTILVFAGCGGPPPALEVSRSTDTPTVYRVTADVESRFSGPVSNLKGGTEITAAFRSTPVSGSAVEVETLYFAANVRDAAGESVALNLGSLTGKKAKVANGTTGYDLGDSRRSQVVGCSYTFDLRT